jgi:serine protease Do
MVTATKPGTSVPVKIMRDRRERTLTVVVDELDLAAEQQSRATRPGGQQVPDGQGSESFGLSLQDLSAQRARQLEMPSGQGGALIVEVDPDGPSAGELRPGDVILQVNRQRVANASEAARELQRIASGRIAQILVWRDGSQVFVTVRRQ